MLKIFIDTEFTDFIDTHLMSLGMVTESGKEFYAEVPYPDHLCSSFVREAVIPLLRKEPQYIFSVDELCERMLEWLSAVRRNNEDVVICFDYQTDWCLFADVLNYSIPEWCRPRLISHQINEVLRYEFYQKNRLPLHHALYDARANRYAFCE
ncbi:3'-5' exoribonuclease [Undibacterium griseum]|uniref:3'-5' exoribonuclease n=1 Tax=Undibacterium griseum TaxID=2762295 RepID=A0ABR6YL60_9BURK|nr:3'-5' exoribonuclease [Undibacterium griseum]MBC3884533.1 3'-5' exoribonuclease [Undibacterium griseum]